MSALQNDVLDELVKSLEKEKPNSAPPAAQTPAPKKSSKISQIREALAMVNDEGESASPAAHSPQHEKLPPLRRSAAPVPELKRANAQKPENNTPAPKPIAKTAPSAKKPAAKAAGKPTPKAAGKAAPKTAKPKAKAGASARPKGGNVLSANGITPRILAATVGCALAGTLIIGYLVVAATYRGRFLPNTYINDTKVGGMNVEAAEVALLGSAKKSDITLTTPKGEKVVFEAKEYGAAYSIPDGSFEEASSETPFAWAAKLFAPSDYSIGYDFTYSEEALRALIQQHDWGDEVSTDACVVRNGDVFEVQPETLGDQFDQDVLVQYIMEQLSVGNCDIQMEDSGCYDSYRAAVTAADLEPELELYNNYANCTITFDFKDRTKVVDSDMIVDWIMLNSDGSVVKDNDGNITFDRQKIAIFVAQMAEETDTFGKDRQFYATLDGWITVTWDGDKSSTYGWQIDQDATIIQLIDLMRAGESVTVEPVYSIYGYERATDDIGTTYVEVDISAQHLWIYRDNVVVSEHDFVSGTETNPDRRTPRGICKIWAKVRNTVLGTMAVQGYEQPVAYWMPFNWLGCGFHDLSRGAYGGNIYMYNGSHGCINLPLSYAKEMFELVDEGMPVIVHD